MTVLSCITDGCAINQAVQLRNQLNKNVLGVRSP